MGRLDSKTAVITGAGAGLGAQIARRFKQEGARLVINDVNEAAAHTLADELGGVGIAADVSDSAAVRSMFEQVQSGDTDFPAGTELIYEADSALIFYAIHPADWASR